MVNVAKKRIFMDKQARIVSAKLEPYHVSGLTLAIEKLQKEGLELTTQSDIIRLALESYFKKLKITKRDIKKGLAGNI